MAIYTRTGDAGSTSLFTGQRVSKTHPRVEAYGTLDELNAVLSLCVCAVAEEKHRTLLEALQQHIFWFSAELASDSEQPSPGKRYISSEEISATKPPSIGPWPASNRCIALFYPAAAKPRAACILPARWPAALNAVWLSWRRKSTYVRC